jgi:hypothetical protein
MSEKRNVTVPLGSCRISRDYHAQRA